MAAGEPAEVDRSARNDDDREAGQRGPGSSSASFAITGHTMVLSRPSGQAAANTTGRTGNYRDPAFKILHSPRLLPLAESVLEVHAIHARLFTAVVGW